MLLYIINNGFFKSVIVSNVLYSNVLVIVFQLHFTNGRICSFRSSFTFQMPSVEVGGGQKQKSIIDVGLTICFLGQ